ncbi:MAG: hypothetical protein WC627_00205 [Legionella sp.]|jgi:hypothetical protein
MERLNNFRENVREEVGKRVAVKLVDQAESKLKGILKPSSQSQQQTQTQDQPKPQNANVRRSYSVQEQTQDRGSSQIQQKIQDKVQDKFEVKAKKTAPILLIPNLLVLTLYKVDVRYGLAASLLINAVLIYQLNKYGKTQGLGNKLQAGTMGFFAVKADADNISEQVKSIVKNVLNAGESLYDDYAPSMINPG